MRFIRALALSCLAVMCVAGAGHPDDSQQVARLGSVGGQTELGNLGDAPKNLPAATSSSCADSNWSSVVFLAPFTSDANDAKGHTVTLEGNAAVSGGYLQLDGTGDHAKVTASSDFDMSTGDFTYEMFVTFTSAPANVYMLAYGTSNSTRLQLGSSVGGWRMFDSVGEVGGGSSLTPSTATEYYYAWKRASGTVTSVYGTSGATTTLAGSSGADSNQWGSNSLNWYIGHNGANSESINGKVRYVRVTKGVARDISTVPTLPLPTC